MRRARAGVTGARSDLSGTSTAGVTRLRVVSALSMLRDEDRIAFPRLQDILRMTAGDSSPQPPMVTRSVCSEL